MSPYRDPLTALRARSAELERLVAERRRQVAEARVRHSSFTVYALAAIFTVTAALLFADGWRHAPPPGDDGLSLHWNGRVVAGNRLPAGTSCTVDVRRPCSAEVRCGSFGYRGEGRCGGGCMFVDSSTADGNPELQVDAKRAVFHGVFHDRLGTPISWFAEVARQ